MSYQEHHYLRFATSAERELRLMELSRHAYYLGHYNYERENTDRLGTYTDYMSCVTIGNLSGGSDKVFGQHVPLDLSDIELVQLGILKGEDNDGEI